MALGFGGSDDRGRLEDPQHEMVEELRKIREQMSKIVKDVDRIREVVERIRDHQK